MYSPQCSRRQRALVIKLDKSNEADRMGKLAHARLSESGESEVVGDVGI